MKRKYHSAIGLFWLVAAAIGAILYPALSSRKVVIRHELPLIRPVGDIRVPAPDVLARIDSLDRELPVLVSGPRRRSDAVDLSMLGYRPMTAGSHAAGQANEPVQVKHKVTMAFYSPTRRFCVIDGQLYPEGASLPEGGRITRIESKRVLLVRGKYRQWIDVVSPMGEVVKNDS